ncbi:ATP-binding cassette domain-containing protein [Rhodobacterales bacterium HKCCE2091]|nr:ATP-binding cassette domain-containing protein [Rhodobacterales bacterium HKCCE2091]
MTAVALSNVSFRYPGAGAAALEAVSLSLPAGGLAAILGPSGCGKTTLLRLVSGLLAPAEGEISFDGMPVTATPAEKRGAAMVFQDALLFPHLTAAENVGFGLRMRHVPRSEIAARTAAMLDLVHLPDLGNRKPSELSGGQQARVALARALIVEPRVLLLDEPLANLDPHLRDEMRGLIADVQARTGITTILVTHDREEAAALADTIAVMIDGRLRQVAAPEKLFARPAEAGVARFLGARNVVAGRAEEGRFHSPLGPLVLPADAPPGAGLLTIRPERIRPGPGANARTATVAAIRFLGASVSVDLLVGDVALSALWPPDLAASLSPGAEVRIALPPEALWVVAQ